MNQEPMHFIDLHTHLLPVDDGCIAPFDTMETLRMLVEQGCVGAFCTPHARNLLEDSARPKALFEELRSVSPIPLYYGCELHLHGSEQRISILLDALRDGRLPTLNGTKWVLAEFDIHVQPDYAAHAVELLGQAGYGIVIAHYERYPLLQSRTQVRRFREQSCLIQCNAGGLAMEHHQWLVREGFADFVGTDTHGYLKRPPDMDTIQPLLADLSPEKSLALRLGNAREILNAAD